MVHLNNQQFNQAKFLLATPRVSIRPPFSFINEVSDCLSLDATIFSTTSFIQEIDIVCVSCECLFPSLIPRYPTPSGRSEEQDGELDAFCEEAQGYRHWVW